MSKKPNYKQWSTETLDYEIDWSLWLEADENGNIDSANATDVIVSADIIADDGIDILADEHNGAAHRFVVNGGIPGNNYTITSRISTINGYINEQSVIIGVMGII